VSAIDIKVAKLRLKCDIADEFHYEMCDGSCGSFYWERFLTDTFNQATRIYRTQHD
ncbi:9242_t:CDS:2, partial [Funneliformis mosseae]